MLPRGPARLLSMLIATALLAGCSQGDGESGGTGSASAYVKDAPSDDFREVHVVFTEVSVHRSGGDDDGSDDMATTGVGTATGTATTAAGQTVSASISATATASSSNTTPAGSSSGWIILFSDSTGVDVDLLNTTGARAAFLGEADLEAGHYQQIRITVKEAWGITHDGEREDITVSSGQLKSVRSFEVEADQETRITIDIDLDRSLRQQGNGNWRMTPVIGKTTAEVVEDDTSGEDTAEPGDIESVPESGSGPTASVSDSGTAAATSSSGTTTSG